MNVSLQDGFNLGWKLGHVLDGRAPAALLSTYGVERKVIARNLIDFDKAWAAALAAKADGSAVAADVPAHFTSTAEFRTGFRTHYEQSMVVGGAEHQDLAKGFPIGQRFASARVVRVADTNPVHLGHQASADGRWRVYVFSDEALPGDDSAVAQTSQWLTASPDSPFTQLPAGIAPHDWFDLNVVYQNKHHDIDVARVPALFLPRIGPLGLVDRGHVYAALPDEDIFEVRGIDRGGAIVVVRPDQYVAQVLPLFATGELAAFFAGCGRQARTVERDVLV
jgi:phenol 2-monooxygenase